MLKKLLLITLLTLSLFGVEIVVDKTIKTPKGVVIDRSTNLMWQDDFSVKTVKKDGNGARRYCKNLNLSGFNDWYLPSMKELDPAADKKRNLMIKKESKNIIFYDSYWHSTIIKESLMTAFTRGFLAKNLDRNVKCVRAGQFDFKNLISNFIKIELNNIPKPPSEINLQRGEFETTTEFNSRVENTKIKQRYIVEKYKKNYAKAKLKAKNKAIKKALEVTWGKPMLSNLKYDADNSVFIADVSFENKKDFNKKVAIKAKPEDARKIKKDFAYLKPQAIFDYDGSSVKLQDIRIPYNKKTYLVQFTDMNIDDTRVAVNLTNDISIDSFMDTEITAAKNTVSTFDSSKLTNFSELDNLLKKSKQVKSNKTKWLFVVGIEKYDYTDNISYATRSAEMFVKTAQKRLGVPESNSIVLLNSNASQAKIKTGMKKLLRRVKNGDTIYFYYNGHGVPVPSLQNAPFMLTADTEPDFVGDEKFFSLQNIYTKLSDSKAKKIIAIVDSCFSGVTDGKSVLKGVAATKMVAKSVSFNKEKMVVLSAGKANQYSNGYNKKGHRLFSFFVMKNIIESDKTIKQLYKDTKIQTYDTSIEEYGDSRTQEPTIDGNFRMSL